MDRHAVVALVSWPKRKSVGRVFGRFVMALAMLVGALALDYSTLQPVFLRELLAAASTAVAVSVLFARPFRIVLVLWIISMGMLAVWYTNDHPSNDRDWRPEYSIPAKFHLQNRIVFAQRVRSFSYRSEDDFTEAYYDANYHLDELENVDLVSSYWAGDAIAHVFLTFGFSGGRHLAFSIETRRARGVDYSTLAGFFHHYELFYVVADERDLIGVRTDIRREQVYLYRLRLSPQVRERLFVSYVDKVNQLVSRPEWYNTVTDNCTTGILNRANTLGDIRYNWRVLLSGYAAEYAYSLGLLNPEQTFADLRRESLIERPPGATINATFSQDIRKGLPLSP
jgi:hypothetical protein